MAGHRTLLGNRDIIAPAVGYGAIDVIAGPSAGAAGSWVTQRRNDEPAAEWFVGSEGTGGQDASVSITQGTWSEADHYSSLWGSTLYGDAWKRLTFTFEYPQTGELILNINNYQQGIYGPGIAAASANTTYQGIAFVPASNTNGTWLDDSIVASSLLQFGGNAEKGTMPNPYHRAYPNYNLGGSSSEEYGPGQDFRVKLLEGQPFVRGEQYNMVIVQDNELEPAGSDYSNRALNTLRIPTIYFETSTTISGLFVSKPGVDVTTADPAYLLFDSTAEDFLQVVKKSSMPIVIPKAESYSVSTNVAVYTSFASPYPDENATMYVDWTVLTPTSNLDPDIFPDTWGKPGDETYAVIPPYLNLDGHNLSSPADTGFVPGYSLTARTYANTITKNVDIVFTNGSPHREHTVNWTLYRTRGL